MESSDPGAKFLHGSYLTFPFSLDDPWYWNRSEELENFDQNLPDIFTTESGRTGLLMREVVDDPRYGLSSEELQEFFLGEPDLALFQPPAKYKIVMNDARTIVCSSE
ncbi:MAG: hypothetical protein WAN35_13885 [Terracidiphilus sp.]